MTKKYSYSILLRKQFAFFLKSR